MSGGMFSSTRKSFSSTTSAFQSKWILTSDGNVPTNDELSIYAKLNL
ncbi:hypothetical protein P700755_003433 [Psychroflexus torquis ATCC 700755]|uniref:Uncharacterized protein n=1 Tax=Psychroflexus torquis (strain ATCC 700755 / CIP 106069 / ACAM 623) TaxID=313595 RepID=K4IX83_PSYTT|nr:hypothetical protein P700755_003433 [Psychroflexus torquis ATCC 700755]